MTHHKYACSGCGCKINIIEKLCEDCLINKELNIKTYTCIHPNCNRKHDRDIYLDSLWRGLCRKHYDDFYFSGLEFIKWFNNLRDE